MITTVGEDNVCYCCEQLNKEYRLQALRASLPTLTLAGAILSAIIESYSLNSDAYVRNLLDSSNTNGLILLQDG